MAPPLRETPKAKLVLPNQSPLGHAVMSLSLRHLFPQAHLVTRLLTEVVVPYRAVSRGDALPGPCDSAPWKGTGIECRNRLRSPRAHPSRLVYERVVLRVVEDARPATMGEPTPNRLDRLNLPAGLTGPSGERRAGTARWLRSLRANLVLPPRNRAGRC